MPHPPPALRLALTGLVALLAACGGGGEDGPAADSTIGRTDANSGAGASADPACGIAGFADQMLAEVNRLRTQGQLCGGDWQAPVPALHWNGALANAAAGHSSDMASHNVVSHTGSDGSSPSGRAVAQGYTSGGVGENLGGGQKDIGHLIRDLLASPAHCANLMRPDYQAVGAACVRNDATVYQRHWTQMFGQ